MPVILVVEDEPNQRRLYQMELEDEGYQVMLASDGREAIRLVEKGDPDLVVLDLHMPGRDGLDSLWRIMGQCAGLPVIIYSGYESFRHNFMTWAADVYLVKSSNLDPLKAEIRRILSERRKDERKPVPTEEQRAWVSVKGGYTPDIIVVKPGQPVCISFYREERSACSELVVFGALGIVRSLPAFETTSVEFLPEETGEFPFTCGKGVLQGKLIVKEA